MVSTCACEIGDAPAASGVVFLLAAVAFAARRKRR
jgi:MYXO-CTERM domain-containing protein